MYDILSHYLISVVLEHSHHEVPLLSPSPHCLFFWGRLPGVDCLLVCTNNPLSRSIRMLCKSSPTTWQLVRYVFKVFETLPPLQSRPLSLLDPDGVCEDGEGWSCSLEIGCGHRMDRLSLHLPCSYGPGVYCGLWHRQPPWNLWLRHGTHICLSLLQPPCPGCNRSCQRLCRLCLLGHELSRGQLLGQLST